MNFVSMGRVSALVLMTAVVLFVTILPSAGATIYVACDGNDANPGTADKPFTTLRAARDKVRRMSKPVRGELKSGIYYLDETLALDPDDSDVAWAAEKGGTAALSGGRRVTGWQKTEGAAWVADVPWMRESGRGFRQLVVNGSCRPRCRAPNKGFYKVLPDPIPKGMPYIVQGDCPRLKYKPGDVDPAWKNPQTGEVIVYHYWTDSHMPIARINAASNTLEFATPAKKTCTAISRGSGIEGLESRQSAIGSRQWRGRSALVRDCVS